MKGLEQRLHEIEDIAERAMNTDISLVRSLGLELQGRCEDLRADIASLDPTTAACWMHDIQELRAELVFTMADPAAQKIGMGSLYRSDDAVADVASKGRRSLAGSRKGGPQGGASSRKVTTDEIMELYEHYQLAGRLPREIPALIARRKGVTAKTVREHLKKSERKPR